MYMGQDWIPPVLFKKDPTAVGAVKFHWLAYAINTHVCKGTVISRGNGCLSSCDGLPIMADRVVSLLNAGCQDWISS